jgi:hypothetical protein
LSQRPTLGAADHESYPEPRGLHDFPIFLRGASLKGLRPITIKRHRLTPIDKVSRLILVERDPIEAILSHTNRSGNASDDDLLAGYKWWSELRQNFEDFDKSHRLLIRFEDVLDGNPDWITELADLIGLSPTAAELDACARALPHAKKVLTRSPQTTSATTYRDKAPQQAAVLDRLRKE